MQIQVSSLSDTPAYEQIKMQIKELVLNGTLLPHTQLPSIRLMAKDLNVGIITVKRAYEELEKENIIVSIQGKGCFVNELDTQEIKAKYLDMLKENIWDIKALSDVYGVKKEDVIKIIDELWEEENA